MALVALATLAKPTMCTVAAPAFQVCVHPRQPWNQIVVANGRMASRPAWPHVHDARHACSVDCPRPGARRALGEGADSAGAKVAEAASALLAPRLWPWAQAQRRR